MSSRPIYHPTFPSGSACHEPSEAWSKVCPDPTLPGESFSVMSLVPRANFPFPDSRSHSILSQVGQQLAIIGDDINRRYDTEFQNLLEQLQPTAGNAYELFTKIASRYPSLHPAYVGSLAGDRVRVNSDTISTRLPLSGPHSLFCTQARVFSGLGHQQ